MMRRKAEKSIGQILRFICCHDLEHRPVVADDASKFYEQDWQEPIGADIRGPKLGAFQALGNNLLFNPLMAA
jgi:hypothetical protein